MILIGASGHAKVIIDILEQSGCSIDFLMDSNKEITSLNNYEVRVYDKSMDFRDKEFIVSIGSNPVRKRIALELGGPFNKAIHPKAIIAKLVSLGEGTVVMAGAIVNSDAKIGAHCILNTGASIDHDCRLEDYVHISPHATLCGTVSVGEGSHIGAGATILPNIQIGKWATVGAGAVVIGNVPDNAVVVGNPAKIIKYNE